MALINCPECNKELSDKVKSCPHCGYPFENEKDNNENQQTSMVETEIEKLEKPKKPKKIKMVIILTILLIIILAGSILYYTQIIQLNKYERYALNIINKLNDITDKSDELKINNVDFLVPIEIKCSQPEAEEFIVEFINGSISKENPACIVSFEVHKNENEPTSMYILSVYDKKSEEYVNIATCMTLDESTIESLYDLGFITYESMKEQLFTAMLINSINNDANKVGNVNIDKIMKAIIK